MTSLFISRRLWFFKKDGERVTITAEAITQLDRPVVILGEAGMGKSKLLERLAETPGYVLCTARKLINSGGLHPSLRPVKVIVIDALDEWSSLHEGDGVDQVLRSLFAINCPPFILSSRVADWRSATGTTAIHDLYDVAPLELHLEPFSKEEVKALLAEQLGPEAAPAIIAHFHDRGLGDLLGNPHTLELIVEVARSGDLPDSTAELFQTAADRLWEEHNDKKALHQLSKHQSLNSAGAAFAALILTGSEAITRVAAGNIGDGEIALSELARLNDGEFVPKMLGTRLFGAAGSDRFTYWHRRIGEFLGAAWLAQQADTPRKRRRLLSLFHNEGIVPASLRGMHAWLARDPTLAEEVMNADPMGVIEYGDADKIGARGARILLKSLSRHALENPQFYDWRYYSAKGLVQKALLPELKSLIESQTEPIMLRAFVLRMVKCAPVVSLLASELCHLLLDHTEQRGIRSLAGQALAAANCVAEWTPIHQTLVSQNTESSLYVAIELLSPLGFDTFSDDYIADLMLAYGVTPDRVSGVLNKISLHLPIARVPTVLDAIGAKAPVRADDRGDGFDINYALKNLLSRVIEADVAAPEKLWDWLSVLQPSYRYTGLRNDIGDQLRTMNNLRRAIQRHVVLDLVSDKSVNSRVEELHICHPALYPDDQDVVALLDSLYALNPADNRWQSLVALRPHNDVHGKSVREAAIAFAANDVTKMDWLLGLTNNQLTEWESREKKREDYRSTDLAARKEERLRRYRSQRNEIRAGSYPALIDSAVIYLGETIDAKDLLPLERLQDWLSSDLVEDVQEGFEAFLSDQSPVPNAAEIVETLIAGKFCQSMYILVAALTERLRKGEGLAGVPDERVLAGFHTTLGPTIGAAEDSADLRLALAEELKCRRVWRDALQGVIEPHLRARRQIVGPLSQVLHSWPTDPDVISLAAEWLRMSVDVGGTVEAQLADFLINRNDFASLRDALADDRIRQNSGRRLLWDSVGLIAEFATTSAQLGDTNIEPDLLWSLRDRIAHWRVRSGPGHAALVKWILNQFRQLYPYTSQPASSMGNTNPWDATEFLVGQIRRLGNDTCAEAVEALETIVDSHQDGYTNFMRGVLTEQTRRRVESAYKPATLDALVAMTTDTTPVTLEDLQAFMLEELELVQKKIRSDDTDSWKGFFGADGPHREERCRDYLIGLLRQNVVGVSLAPETHVANDKKVDITCEAGALRLPIEVKGQWHASLWHAADSQLDALYTPDWRAGGRGIYLVLWFGKNVPPCNQLQNAGRGVTAARTARELEMMLKAGSRSPRDGRITVFVMDLERG